MNLSWKAFRVGLIGPNQQTAGALLVAVFILSLSLVATHRLRVVEVAHVEAERELLTWTKAQESVVRGLRAARPAALPSVPVSGESLVATVSGLAQRYELPVMHSETATNGSVSIALTDARFDHTLIWLSELVRDRAIVIERLELDRGSQPGLVNVQARMRS